VWQVWLRLAQTSVSSHDANTRMNVIRVDRSSSIDPEILRPAADLLRSGKLVAFPTETVYGLGANALDADAVRQIFVAKGRPSDNPLIVHISSLDMLERVSRLKLAALPLKVRLAIDAFWPGPLTLVFPREASVPNLVTAGLDTVAVRFPSDPIALALISAAGVPVAAPSANVSGRPSSTRASHVIQDFFDRGVPCLIDGGPCEVGLESTVADLFRDPPMILRPGGVTLEQLSKVVGDSCCVYGMNGQTRDHTLEEKPPTPGMKYKHYSPNASVHLYVGSTEGVKLRLLDDLRTKYGLSEVGLVVHSSETSQSIGNLITQRTDTRVHLINASGDAELAHCIFNALRELDADGVSDILIEGTDEKGLGMAVMNRLRKAASDVVVC